MAGGCKNLAIGSVKRKSWTIAYQDSVEYLNINGRLALTNFKVLLVLRFYDSFFFFFRFYDSKACLCVL